MAPARLDAETTGPEVVDARGRYLGELYCRLPFNLIPAADVLDYGFAYGGPCGAKSRLRRSVDQPQHGGFRATPHRRRGLTNWTTAGARSIPHTASLFRDASGSLAPTSVVASEPEVFQRGAGRDESYPLATYTYVNVSRLTVFYVLQRRLRSAGLASGSDVSGLYAELDRVLPSGVLEYDIGVPYLYEEPEPLAAVVGLSLTLLFGIAARRLG